MKGTVAEKIDEMVRRIVEGFAPDQIILFGSHVHGTAHPGSDVDILVVMQLDGSEREKEAEIDVALGDLRLSKDIFDATPGDVERRRNVAGTIIRAALREGKVLHAREGGELPALGPARRFGEGGCSMAEADEMLTVVRAWVEKAEEDLVVAEQILTVSERCPLGPISFHAQQCVEKYIKAFLVLKGIDFPRTHDIARLVALLPAPARPPLTPEEQKNLTRYAAVVRYPEEPLPLTRADAEEAVSAARKVREAFRALFPGEAMGR